MSDTNPSNAPPTPPPIVDVIAEPVPPPRRRRGIGFAIGVALVLGAGLGAVAIAVWPDLPRRLNLAAPSVQQDTAGFEQRLKTLEALLKDAGNLQTRLGDYDRRLKLLEATLGAPPPVAAQPAPPPDLKAIEDRLATVEAHLADDQKTLAAVKTALGTIDQDQLADRVRNLEEAAGRLAQGLQADRRALDGVAAVVVALEPLRQAVRKGGPFATELAALKPLLGDPTPDPYGVLAQFADKGVPTVADLQRSFPALARAALSADGRAAGGEWWQKALSRLETLVTIRRTGAAAAAGDGIDAALARAEDALAQGDAAAAVAALQGLSAPAKAAAQDWLAQAGRRVTADVALNGLEAALLGRLRAAK